MDAAQIVGDARARTGVSQRRLAYRAGTDQGAISRIERGEVSPSLETLDRLLAAMGEELVVEARPRPLPYEDEQFERAILSSSEDLLARGVSWNRFAGRMSGAVAEAWGRGQR